MLHAERAERPVGNEPALWRGQLPRLLPDAHKYSRGAVTVLSGAVHATGAARLAAAAALRTGAGIVTIASPSEAVPVNAGYLAALVVKPSNDVASFRALLGKSDGAVVVGPAAGVGEGTADRVLAALETGWGVVIDADAITSFADQPERLFATIRTRRGATVLTPHEGEFPRLFPDLEGSRSSRALAAAQRSGAVVVLKGRETLIAAPDGRLVVNRGAPPDLATAGAGDVLCGVVAALLAGGMAAFDAAAAAVWIHGAAGTRAGPGLIADDLPAAIRTVMNDLRA